MEDNDAEILAFIERYERLGVEKDERADDQKEVMAEAKGRGYNVAVLKAIVAIRKRNPGDLAEFEAIMELYKSSLGMS